MSNRALVLFAHGARDPRWAEPFRRLQALVQGRLPDTRVELAFLELMEPRLPQLVEGLLREQCREVTVVPVFFGQGGHVLRDLPAMTEQLRQAHPELALRVAPAVGEDEAVLGAIAHYCISRLEP
jgi:sirohydrochlorin cobaltochelatase